ncbi:hypothetical protein O4106_22005 [Rhodococcus pyridinivorans]|uniref:hypothetical protein n=1 Tax=Rhodococcus pyridinivorans TaxID=103816 RepID=UPI0022B5B3CC|nr:hypothetical protein [Rhodococcus pyridinivorans]MCZ4649500.1 hypothetical protein [Rhodococcus pyridinivorans]
MTYTNELDNPSRKMLILALHNISEWLADELDNTITRQTAKVQTVGGASPETPLPLNINAMDVAIELHGTLGDWINQVCLTHKHRHPGRLRIGPAAAWLYRHYLDLMRHENIVQAAKQIIESYDRAYRIVDLKDQRPLPEIDQTKVDEADRMVLNASAAARLAKSVGYQDLTVRRIKYLRESGRITPVHTAGRNVVFLFGDIRRAHQQCVEDEHPVAS